MTYCDIDEVRSLIISPGFDFTTTSNITTDQINNDILPSVDRYIDDRIGKYYGTPITGTNALLSIKRIARWLAAAEITERTYIGQTPSDSPQATTWRQYAEDDISRIIKGEILLPDAVPTNDTPEAMSRLISDKLSQPTYTTQAKFSMGMKF